MATALAHSRMGAAGLLLKSQNSCTWPTESPLLLLLVEIENSCLLGQSFGPRYNLQKDPSKIHRGVEIVLASWSPAEDGSVEFGRVGGLRRALCWELC